MMQTTLGIAAACVALVVVSATAGAQQKTKVETRTPRGRTGVMPAPVVQAGPNVATPPREQVDERRERHRRPRYVFLADGSLVADVGNGYEQVIPRCGSAMASGSAGTVITGGGSALQPVPRADTARTTTGSWQPYSPPVYSAPAASAAPRGPACWTTDANGQVLFLQP